MKSNKNKINIFGHMALCSLITTTKKSESEVVRVHLMQSKCASRRGATLILNLDTRKKCVAQFTPQSIYPEERTTESVEQEAVWAP